MSPIAHYIQPRADLDCPMTFPAAWMTESQWNLREQQVKMGDGKGIGLYILMSALVLINATDPLAPLHAHCIVDSDLFSTVRSACFFSTSFLTHQLQEGKEKRLAG